MRRRPIITLAPLLLALAAPGFALGYAGTGGEAAPVSIGGGTGQPDPPAVSPTPPAPAPAAADPSGLIHVTSDSAATPRAGESPGSGSGDGSTGDSSTGGPASPKSPGQSAGVPVAPAQAFAAEPQIVLDTPTARSAQTPVEPQPGGPNQPDPFVPPTEPAPKPAKKPQATAPGLPLSGPQFYRTLFLGSVMFALGVAGLALSRSRELSALR
ncbi:MAG: hypothetical protein QOE65_2084 [Solirubrobacteraceae bacterium]|jgi:hypothetical protein|nr:hypothetical protein [Solirubrobacteraceae bacterium]